MGGQIDKNGPAQPPGVVFNQRPAILMKKLEHERVPSPLVLQDQRIQDVAAADTSPSDKAEMPAVIQHIVEMVLHHQPATP